MIEVHIPQLGMGIQEVQIVRWLKAEGERVAEDEPIVEIETAKSTSEIPAPASGILVRQLVAEGDTVPVYEVAAHIDDAAG